MATPFDPRATASLLLGLLSLLTGAFAGIPAFILGSQARRDEERVRILYPHLPPRVAGVALAGMLTGALGTFLGVAWVAGTAGYWYAQKQQQHATYSFDLPSHLAGGSPLAGGTNGSNGSGASGGTSASGTRASHANFGSIRVVDLDEEDPLPFRDRLRAELKTAHQAGHPVIVETTKTECRSCDEISTALHDDLMQRAFAGVTLVRVDVDTFEDELRAAGMWQDSLPWFYRLDSNMRPTDAISADEWDDNTGENMAPVLGPFSHGTLKNRRSPSPLTISL